MDPRATIRAINYDKNTPMIGIPNPFSDPNTLCDIRSFYSGNEMIDGISIDNFYCNFIQIGLGRLKSNDFLKLFDTIADETFKTNHANQLKNAIRHPQIEQFLELDDLETFLHIFFNEEEIDLSENPFQGALMFVFFETLKTQAEEEHFHTNILVEAVTKHFKDRDVVIDDPQNVVLANSSSSLVFSAAVNALHERHPNRKLLLCMPAWHGLTILSDRNTSLGLVDTSKTHYKITPELLQEAIDTHGPENIMAIGGTFPNNPTYQVHTHQEMRDIATFLATHPNIVVICDELYAGTECPEMQHVSLASVAAECGMCPEQLIIIDGTSKEYNLRDTFKIGFAYVGDKTLATEIQERIDSHCDRFDTMRAILPALVIQQTNERQKTFNRQNIQKRKEAFLVSLETINRTLGENDIKLVVQPEAGFFACLQFPELYKQYGINTSGQLSRYLLAITGVATDPLDAYGMDLFGVRINFSEKPNEVPIALERMKNLRTSPLKHSV
jgi:aspartate/methionine/tyrosine aminotransferase